MSKQYNGSCHCGAIRFSYEGEEITAGLRCSCSICARKGAMMSPEAIPLEALTIEVPRRGPRSLPVRHAYRQTLLLSQLRHLHAQ